MMVRKSNICASILAAMTGVAFMASSAFAEGQMKKGISILDSHIKSGYYYAEPETKGMNDDDFENPAMLWVDSGIDLWNTPMGPENKTCQSCHGDIEEMRGLTVGYPKYSDSRGLYALQHKIQWELEEKMGVKPWKWESKEMLSVVAALGFQSRGLPMQVATDGPYKKFYDQGKAFYYERRGQLDMACKHCHEDNPGNMIRAERLSQGQANGFPTYRLKWNGLGSLHRRFRGCNNNIRAEPFKRGSLEYTSLELYLKSRGPGLLIEAPSTRK